MREALSFLLYLASVFICGTYKEKTDDFKRIKLNKLFINQ